jgi:predicted nucleic acid-binding protein
MFDKIYIPYAVYDETVLSQKTDNVASEIELLIAKGQVIRFDVRNELAIKALSGRLHLGEVQVIIGASELGIQEVLLDDLHARNKAKQFDLNIIGTLGILKLAYKRGITYDLKSDIVKLLDADFRISSSLLQRILDD